MPCLLGTDCLIKISCDSYMTVTGRKNEKVDIELK
jgi:hypothetical protein